MPADDAVSATITSAKQIVITLDPVMIPFRYEHIEITGFLLDHGDLTITVKASVPGEGVRTNGTRAIVLSERQLAAVMSSLRRRAALHPNPLLDETIEHIEAQRDT